MQTRRLWTNQEDEAILLLVEKLGTKRWSEISENMKSQFMLEGRTGKQCRERWHNHLAPDLNKKPWTVQEQASLFEAHRKLGNRWTQISKIVLGRTDNAIKNHFYSSVRRSLRRMGKILGTKNSTNEIRTLKPAVLSTMFKFYDKNSKSAPEELKNLPSALFMFSQKKTKKNSEIQENERKNLQNLIQKLKEFNETYQKNRSGFKSTYSNDSEEEVSDPEQEMIDENVDANLDHCQNRKQQNIFVKKEEEPMDNLPSVELHLENQEYQDFDHRSIRINLEESAYDWAKFESKCDLVRNHLLSQNSLCLKSDHLLPSDGWTPVKGDREDQVRKNSPL